MFDTLSEKIGGILNRLTGRGALSENDVREAMREVRKALIEADVALEVARAFTDKAAERATGTDVIRSVTPGQMVVKIVHDELVNVLGADARPIDLFAAPPAGPMPPARQHDPGKTTTPANIAKRLKERMKKKALMASLDTRRPAAMEQLAGPGRENGGHPL